MGKEMALKSIKTGKLGIGGPEPVLHLPGHPIQKQELSRKKPCRCEHLENESRQGLVILDGNQVVGTFLVFVLQPMMNQNVFHLFR